MMNSNEKKKGYFQGVEDKLIPTIYQVRFTKMDDTIQFESFPELKELGDWLTTTKQMWACHSTIHYKYDTKGFEKKFLEITKLPADNVLISKGGVGFNYMTPGYRDLL